LLDAVDMLRKPTISLEVKTLDGLIKAKRSISIKSYDPKIVFYKKDALLGTLFNKAILGSFDLLEEEISIEAYPFFFSKDDVFRSNLKYNWSMNNKKIEDNNNIIILRKSENSSGNSSINLKIENKNKFMQIAEGNFNIFFKKGSSLFEN